MPSSALVVVVLLALAATGLGCNGLCQFCYSYSTYDYCSSCKSNAYSVNTTDCACYSGYYRSGDDCYYGSSGLALWVIILIVISNIAFIACIVACIVSCVRKRRQNQYGAYNRLGDQVAVVQPEHIYAQPVYPNPTRPTNPPYPNNPTRPTGQVNPRNAPANPYVPSNPYVPQAVCQICMQGNCDCQTSCGHASHRACLDRWTYPTCPTCGAAAPELKK